MALELTAQEADALSEVLRRYLGDLRAEIADTDNAQYRRGLRDEQRLLEGIADRVTSPAGAPPSEPPVRAAVGPPSAPPVGAAVGQVAFVELGVADTARGRTFYEGLLGWAFTPGPSAGGFMIATPNVPAGMHGGDAGAAPYVFFAVDDMEAALQRVRDLGGAVDEADVEGDPETQARFGRFKLCQDDQGSPFGLHQPPAH